MLEPVKKVTVSDNIVKQIRALIEEGKISVGQKLPAERELAQQLSVSRISVREAIKSLAVMGLVEVRSGEGTFVRSITPQDVADPIRYAMLMERRTLRELLEVRRVLEVELAGLAAERATPEDLEVMEQTLFDMARDIEVNRNYLDSDIAFHNAITEAAGNTLLHNMISTVGDLMIDSRRKTTMVPGSGLRALRGHQQIFDRIKARDAQGARQAMRDHLVDVEADLAAYEGTRGNVDSVGKA
ncbi:MAG: FadR family transcriptional regulator [Actinobacteria bacterium]|nr:FadR family transcriptional regulator [Actinomycetota bacterium]